jgi:hypothetical protein
MAADGLSLPGLLQAQSTPVPSQRRERPLPNIPVSNARPKSFANDSPTIPQPSAAALGKRKAATAPMMLSSEALRRMLRSPDILSCLVEAMAWSSFHALISTCKDFRQIQAEPVSRDVILARFVPGYKLCFGNRDVAELSVDITIEDLVLFRESYIRSYSQSRLTSSTSQKCLRTLPYIITLCMHWLS